MGILPSILVAYCFLFSLFVCHIFTSKLANNTEIVAILSSGVSFNRFLRPYLIGASMIAVLMFFMVMFLVPYASKGYNEFIFKYLKKGKKTVSLTTFLTKLTIRTFCM